MLTEKSRLPIREVIFYGFWPGFIKRLIYRLKGYTIGKGVSIGFGAVILGDTVQIGDQSSFGFFTIVRGKTIKIGSHVQIGSTTILDTPHLEIGDGSRINEQVFVGGLQFPDSKLVMGRNCQIMQMSFINPTRSITIGDDTGIGGHSLIFGHTSWLSQFEGYPVDFSPIEIGNSVSIAWRVFVLPGSKIGDGAVVGANSVVTRKIPPRCLALGFPARVVSKAPQFPKDLSEEDKVKILRDIVSEMGNYFQQCGFGWTQNDPVCHVTTQKKNLLGHKTHIWKLAVDFNTNTDPLDLIQGPIDVYLSLSAIPDSVRTDLSRNKTMWIDIAKKEQSTVSNDLGEEIAAFLKRYGVRLYREEWGRPSA